MTVSSVDLLEVARAWSPWQQPVLDAVERNVDLPIELRDSLALAVVGVRRCGKSTLLQQLVKRYELPPERCVFVNFEDPRLSRALEFETLARLVVEFRERVADGGPLYFFLDEIQRVEGWQKWLRMQLDRPGGNHFVITGSNSDLLGGELGTVLTGRHLTVELFPFSLAERRRREPELTLTEFLSSGGFPEPTTMADGDRLRRQYFFDIVERDVRERLGARSSLAIQQVVQMVFESAGSELSLRRIAGATGIAVETAQSYLEACESAYLLFSCPYFAFSERKRAVRNRKYYPIDTGLRRVVTTLTGRDRGKALECMTFLELKRRFREVYYWRDGGEVDFVVRPNGREILPIQVTWDEPQDRHHRALEDFYERFPQANEALFVTADSFPALAREIA